MIRFLFTCSLLLVILSPCQSRSMPEKERDAKEEKSVSKKRKTPCSEQFKTSKSKADNITKKAKNKVVSSVKEEDVTLIPGKGTKASGGGRGGHYWNVFCQDKRAGKAFINFINEKPLGEHPSLQIFLNKDSQGKHIGRYAYMQACKLSQYDKVFAYMSKKNIPSIRAATAAGFAQILANKTRQVIMQWIRKK